MRLSDFDYHLPSELIAQEPSSPRDSCRLLVLDRRNGKITHRHFFEIGEYLRPGDLLVLNNTKVFKARLIGELDGKKVEIFLIRPSYAVIPAHRFLPAAEDMGTQNNELDPRVKPEDDMGVWLALGKPGRRLRLGEVVRFAGDFFCKILSKNESGELTVDFNLPAGRVIDLANQYGHVPIPPYIKKEPERAGEYQTVYATKTGSVAAPTAGLHFTEELIEKLKEQEVELAEITLHVGLGTFLPVKTEKVEVKGRRMVQ